MDKKDVCVCMCIYIYTYIYIYIYIERERERERGILLSHKKVKIMPLAATWMDLEGIMLSEVSQTEEDIYCMTSHMTSHMWDLKNTKI